MSLSESEGHFPVIFPSLRQYSQIIEEEQSQLEPGLSLVVLDGVHIVNKNKIIHFIIVSSLLARPLSSH